MPSAKAIWNSYSGVEKRNIAIYIAGIMCYKVGLEFFNGSITTLATDRFNAAEAFTKLGAAQGVNQAAQCVGAIMIAPLVKRWPTRTVLSFAILTFGLMTTILLIVDAATGGKFKDTENNKVLYGSWPPNLIFFIWTVSGIAYGMVELIRRVIPADIVGGDVNKLRRMDATVHIFYEVAGTAGAFSSASAISRWGNNYSFFLTPVFFAFAGATWLFISALGFRSPEVIEAERAEVEGQGLEEVEHSRRSSNNYFVQIYHGFLGFGESIWVGGRLIFGNRAFIWLLPTYSIALYLHRYLESGLAPAFAKKVLGTSAWSQIIVGGSNFGELIGALAVLILSDRVPTPLPWLRLDALALNIVWVLPTFAMNAKKDVSWAWRVAGSFIPISMGWAAGDVSLAAYIQSTLSASSFRHDRVSALGAVMACLYSTYIVLNAVLSATLGRVIDKDKDSKILHSLRSVGGTQFSVGCAIILLATFIPKGGFSFNPQYLGGVHTKSSGASEDEEESVEEKKHQHIDTNPLP
ncbi:hypothetical protein BKA70DRAFT_1422830 [Coprinopsis sp. MPI-PUGE-AT-0042]|nr:hypothetical protein BKA70DRAFT_1422830 [Coprinopsis sp. MPI-PUGE-AT-0042]